MYGCRPSIPGAPETPRRTYPETAVDLRGVESLTFAGCHTMCHSLAAHLLEAERKDVRTTMIYTHVLNRGGQGVRSPIDGL